MRDVTPLCAAALLLAHAATAAALRPAGAGDDAALAINFLGLKAPEPPSVGVAGETLRLDRPVEVHPIEKLAFLQIPTRVFQQPPFTPSALPPVVEPAPAGAPAVPAAFWQPLAPRLGARARARDDDAALRDAVAVEDEAELRARALQELDGTLAGTGRWLGGVQDARSVDEAVAWLGAERSDASGRVACRAARRERLARRWLAGEPGLAHVALLGRGNVEVDRARYYMQLVAQFLGEFQAAGANEVRRRRAALLVGEHARNFRRALLSCRAEVERRDAE